MQAVSQMQGISYDNTFNSYGGTNTNRGATKLKEDIEILLRQEKYKFFPDPEFGTEIHKYLFEEMTPALGELIRNEAYNTILKYYPDLILDSVDATMADNTIELSINVRYANEGQAENIKVIFEREVD